MTTTSKLIFDHDADRRCAPCPGTVGLRAARACSRWLSQCSPLSLPGGSLLALTLVFGAFSFADGLFRMVAAIRNIRKGERWGWLLWRHSGLRHLVSWSWSSA